MSTGVTKRCPTCRYMTGHAEKCIDARVEAIHAERDTVAVIVPNEQSARVMPPDYRSDADKARHAERVREINEASRAHAVGLPEDSAARKACPVFSGVLAYFPDALAEVARLSKVGNDKHNFGEPLHWSKEKSSDHDDCIIRHQLDVAKGHKFIPDYGSANIRTRSAVAWRALAALQIEIETESK